MTGFVRTESFPSGDDLDNGNPERITDDETIGMLHARQDEHLRGDVVFDLRRLRRAILLASLVGETSPTGADALVQDGDA